MNWFDRILDFIHLAWFEVTQAVSSVWRHIRIPFWVWVLAIAILIFCTLVGFWVVLLGTVAQSDWVIFVGGLAVLIGIALIGIALIPAVLIVNFLRRHNPAAMTTVRETTTVVAPAAAPHHGEH